MVYYADCKVRYRMVKLYRYLGKLQRAGDHLVGWIEKTNTKQADRHQAAPVRRFAFEY